MKMLQLWQRSVTEEDCTYSALAAALEKEWIYRNCAYEYCYTTGNHMNICASINYYVHVLMGNYILQFAPD